MRNYLLYIILLIASQVGLAAEIYRVIGENGRVHYSQIPPYKGAEKVILKSHASESDVSHANTKESLFERQKKYSDYLESERLERKEKREKIKQEKAELSANCYAAREDLSEMNQGGVLYYDVDNNGERIYVDESRVQEKKQRLQDYLDRNCKNNVKN